MDTTVDTTNMKLTATEERALKLLSAGVPQTQVAQAIGVSDSLISQLLAREEFAQLLAAERYANLMQHNERDLKYDAIEDKLLNQLEEVTPLLMKPTEITRVLQVINGAKRRGISSPDQVVQQQAAVKLTMPVQIIQKFTTNIDNLVVQAGEQNLVTMQSATLLQKVKEARQNHVSAITGSDSGKAIGATAEK